MESKTKEFTDIDMWECFSLVTNTRTLDFTCNESQVDNWFHGVKFVFDQLFFEKFP